MLLSAMFQSGSMQVDDSLFGFVQEHAMIEQNKASGGLLRGVARLGLGRVELF